MQKEKEKIILAAKEQEFRLKMVGLFEREIRFMKHRGIRTPELRALTFDQVLQNIEIFKNCVEKINFLRSEKGEIVGWELKETDNCEGSA